MENNSIITIENNSNSIEIVISIENENNLESEDQFFFIC